MRPAVELCQVGAAPPQAPGALLVPTPRAQASQPSSHACRAQGPVAAELTPGRCVQRETEGSFTHKGLLPGLGVRAAFVFCAVPARECHVVLAMGAGLPGYAWVGPQDCLGPTRPHSAGEGATPQLTFTHTHRVIHSLHEVNTHIYTHTSWYGHIRATQTDMPMSVFPLTW